jgi:hypothetical protein
MFPVNLVARVALTGLVNLAARVAPMFQEKSLHLDTEVLVDTEGTEKASVAVRGIIVAAPNHAAVLKDEKKVMSIVLAAQVVEGAAVETAADLVVLALDHAEKRYLYRATMSCPDVNLCKRSY